MSKKLLIINPEQNMEVPLEQQLTIGRDVYNSLSLLDADVSRSHAIIFEMDDKAIIKDLNSRNGVFVNGEKVIERELKDGDEITLGSTILILNPQPGYDAGERLTSRARQILTRRQEVEPAPRSGPVNIYNVDRMERVLQRLMNQTEEGAKYFTVGNALALLKTYREMDASFDGAQLSQIALRRIMAIVGGGRGVIMETDETKSKLKVRAMITEEADRRKLEIPQQVLKIVLDTESCVFSPDVAGDANFQVMATRESRPIHSFLAAPITAMQSYYGFVYLESLDPSVEYDFVAMRSLFMITSHLGSLLQPRKTHFPHPVAHADED